MQKFIPFLTLIFLVSLIGISTYNLNKKQENEQNKISENSEEFSIHFKPVKITLPDFSLPELFDENKNFSKKDLVGKYSIINFFASWCTTCRAEHEILLRLQGEGIVDLYGVAWHDIDENTRNYLQRSGNPFKKVGSDNRGLFTKITGIKALPETLIIDPKGNVVMRYRGNLQEFSVEEIGKFLRERN